MAIGKPIAVRMVQSIRAQSVPPTAAARVWEPRRRWRQAVSPAWAQRPRQGAARAAKCRSSYSGWTVRSPLVSDLARQPLLADAELVDAERYPLLTSGDTGSDPIYAPRNLLLTGSHIVGDPVDALPHRIEIERRYVGPLLIGRRGSLRRQSDRVGTAACNSCGLRRQPAKLRIRTCDPLSRCIAIRLPSKGGSDTNAKHYQETDEGEQDSLAERRPPV